jgi:hypothetical protein
VRSSALPFASKALPHPNQEGAPALSLAALLDALHADGRNEVGRLSETR